MSVSRRDFLKKVAAVAAGTAVGGPLIWVPRKAGAEGIHSAFNDKYLTPNEKLKPGNYLIITYNSIDRSTRHYWAQFAVLSPQLANKLDLFQLLSQACFTDTKEYKIRNEQRKKGVPLTTAVDLTTPQDDGDLEGILEVIRKGNFPEKDEKLSDQCQYLTAFKNAYNSAGVTNEKDAQVIEDLRLKEIEAIRYLQSPSRLSTDNEIIGIGVYVQPLNIYEPISEDLSKGHVTLSAPLFVASMDQLGFNDGWKLSGNIPIVNFMKCIRDSYGSLPNINEICNSIREDSEKPFDMNFHKFTLEHFAFLAKVGLKGEKIRKDVYGFPDQYELIHSMMGSTPSIWDAKLYNKLDIRYHTSKKG